MKLSFGLRWAFYAVFGLLFLTGVVWLLLPGGSDPALPSARAAWSPLCLKLHGAAAMAALVIWGWLFPVHIAPGLKAGRNLASGLVMLGAVFILVLTGYGLYYLGDDTWRAMTSLIHW